MIQRMMDFFTSWFIYPGLSRPSLLVSVGLAVAFGAIWFSAYWTPVLKNPRAWAVLLGSAILTVVAISFIQLPLQFWSGMALLNFWSNNALMQWLWLAAIPQILLTGLVQEASKLAPVAVYWWCSGRSIDPRMGMALGAVAGAGFGVYEAMWAHGTVFIAGWSWNLVQAQGLLALAPFWERFFVVGLHISMSALAGYGLARGRWWQFYLLAALIHALVNYSAVLAAAGLWGMVALEVYVAALSIVITGAVLWVRWHPAAARANRSSAAGPAGHTVGLF
ncbi:MAG: hypothetical protein V1691_02415 [Chloroflexota bacterium]